MGNKNIPFYTYLTYAIRHPVRSPVENPVGTSLA